MSVEAAPPEPPAPAPPPPDPAELAATVLLLLAAPPAPFPPVPDAAVVAVDAATLEDEATELLLPVLAVVVLDPTLLTLVAVEEETPLPVEEALLVVTGPLAPAPVLSLPEPLHPRTAATLRQLRQRNAPGRTSDVIRYLAEETLAPGLSRRPEGVNTPSDDFMMPQANGEAFSGLAVQCDIRA